MSDVPATPVRRSIAAPIVIGVAGFALVATLLLYLVTLWVVRSESDAALRQGVDVEIAALADIYATGGRGELTARIGDRLALNASGADRAHYLLADASGARIAGDIVHWPLLSAENSQTGFVTLSDGTRVFARATQLDRDLRIVAAREYGGRRQLIARIGIAFAATGALILLAAFLLGWRAAARVRRRVDGINTAFRAIEAGDLHERAPVGADDELGELARHANTLVTRLGALIVAQRDVTDQVAHEIRTPLMHLDTRLLKLIDHSVDPAQIEALGAVRHEARGIADLLDSLLDIAASEARLGDRTGFDRVDLSELAENVADLYADSAEEFGLDLVTDIAPDVELSGDAMQLTRVLSNLLDNAFKYTGSGGRILLSVAEGPRIVVQDNGPGVAEPMREAIFERFQRAGGGKGHGLGLALVRAIVRRHGLEVRCEDAAPGAAFIIEREGSK